MSIKGRMILLGSISLVGLTAMLLILGITLGRNISQASMLFANPFLTAIEKDIPEIDKLNKAITQTLNARREAFQARSAEKLGLGIDDANMIERLHAEGLEKAGLVRERMNAASGFLNIDESRIHDDFLNHHEIWRKKSALLMTQSADVANGARKMQTAHEAAVNSFSQMRKAMDRMEVENSDWDGAGETQKTETERLQAFSRGLELDGYRALAISQAIMDERDPAALETLAGDCAGIVAQMSDRIIKAPQKFTWVSPHRFWPVEREIKSLQRNIADQAQAARRNALTRIERERSAEASRAAFTLMSGAIATLEQRLETRIENQFNNVGKKRAKAVVDNMALISTMGHSRAKALWAGAGLTALILGLTIFMAGRMALQFSDAVELLERGSAEIALASNQIVNSGRTLTVAVRRQKASISSGGTIINTLSDMINRNNCDAQRIKTRAGAIQEHSRQIAGTMARIHETAAEIKRSSDETSGVVHAISEIATKAHLLSLNTAIKAARAGGTGKEFDEAAEEARSLARQCAHATRHADRLISQSRANVNDGISIFSEIDGLLSELDGQYEELDRLSENVSTVSRTQVRNVGEINRIISSMERDVLASSIHTKLSAAAGGTLTTRMIMFTDIVRELREMIHGAGREAANAQIDASPNIVVNFDRTDAHRIIKTLLRPPRSLPTR